MKRTIVVVKDVEYEIVDELPASDPDVALVVLRATRYPHDTIVEELEVTW